MGRAYEKGVRGEGQAAAYLQATGYTVLERNFRCGTGEVDIVAKKADTLVFVEVKAWDAYGYADLEYSVDRRKRSRILQASQCYLARNRRYDGSACRFDIMFVRRDGAEIRHVEGAFAGTNWI
jgi:putative endonuclease